MNYSPISPFLFSAFRMQYEHHSSCFSSNKDYDSVKRMSISTAPLDAKLEQGEEIGARCHSASSSSPPSSSLYVPEHPLALSYLRRFVDTEWDHPLRRVWKKEGEKKWEERNDDATTPGHAEERSIPPLCGPTTSQSNRTSGSSDRHASRVSGGRGGGRGQHAASAVRGEHEKNNTGYEKGILSPIRSPAPAVAVPDRSPIRMNTKEWWNILHVYAPLNHPSYLKEKPNVVSGRSGNENRRCREERSSDGSRKREALVEPLYGKSQSTSEPVASLSWRSFDPHGREIRIECIDEVEDIVFPCRKKKNLTQDESTWMNHSCRASSSAPSKERHLSKVLGSLQTSLTAYRRRCSPSTCTPDPAPLPCVGSKAVETKNDRRDPGDESLSPHPRTGKSASLVSLVVLTSTTLQTCLEVSTLRHASRRNLRTEWVSRADPVDSDIMPSPSPFCGGENREKGKVVWGSDGGGGHPLPSTVASNTSFDAMACSKNDRRRSTPHRLATSSPSSPSSSDANTLYFSPVAAASTLLDLLGKDVIQKELRQLVWATLRHHHQALQDGGEELAHLFYKAQALQEYDADPSSSFNVKNEHAKTVHISWEEKMKEFISFSKSMIMVHEEFIAAPLVGSPLPPPSPSSPSSSPSCKDVHSPPSTGADLGLKGREGNQKNGDAAPKDSRESHSSGREWPPPPPPSSTSCRKIPFPWIQICSPHHGDHFHFIFSPEKTRKDEGNQEKEDEHRKTKNKRREEKGEGEGEKSHVRATTTTPTVMMPMFPPSHSASLKPRAMAWTSWMGRPSTVELWKCKEKNMARRFAASATAAGGLQGVGVGEEGKPKEGSSPTPHPHRGGTASSPRVPSTSPPFPRGVGRGPLHLTEALTILRNEIALRYAGITTTLTVNNNHKHNRQDLFSSSTSSDVQSFTSLCREVVWMFFFEVSQLRIALSFFLRMELLLQDVKDMALVASVEQIERKNEEGEDRVTMGWYRQMKMEEKHFQLVADILRFVKEESEETSRLLSSSRHWTRFVRKAQVHEGMERSAAHELKKTGGEEQNTKTSSSEPEKRKWGGGGDSFSLFPPSTMTSCGEVQEDASHSVSLGKNTLDGFTTASNNYSSVEEIFKGLVDECKKRRRTLLHLFNVKTS